MNDLKPTELTEQLASGDTRSPGETDKVINDLYNYVTNKAIESINWYYAKRNPKRRFGLLLRYCSILFVALAGILPILITIFEECKIDSSWSAVAVALAVLMIGIDKFGGFTSGWIRYVIAAQNLTQALEEFRFDWEQDKLRLAGTTITPDDAQNKMNKCKEFLQKVQLIVSDETQKWVVEFQSALSDLDVSTKAAADSAKELIKTKEKGAVAIQVENGNSCDIPWTLELDGKVISKYSGKSAALSGLTPGIIVLKISGVIKGINVQAQTAVTIKGGEIASVNITLV